MIFVKKVRLGKRICGFGILYNAWVETIDIRKKVLKLMKLPTFYCPFESLFIKDLINIEWGKNLRSDKKDPCREWEILKRSFEENSLILFTDGSSSKEGQKGCGIYIHNSDNCWKYKIDESNSIFSTELYAIWKALELASFFPPTRVVIFSNSIGSLQSLASNDLNSKLHPYSCFIRKQISTLQLSGTNIKIYWIPGHTNIQGNFMADKAAKEARNINDFIFHFSPVLDLLPNLKIDLLTDMQNFCISYGKFRKGRLYVSHADEFNLTPWFAWRGDLGRRQICLVNRLRSGC